MIKKLSVIKKETKKKVKAFDMNLEERFHTPEQLIEEFEKKFPGLLEALKNA